MGKELFTDSGPALEVYGAEGFGEIGQEFGPARGAITQGDFVASHMDLNMLRPYRIDPDMTQNAREVGSYVTVNNRVRRIAANALLRKDEWERLDDAMISIAAQENTTLEAFRAAGLVDTSFRIGDLISLQRRSSDLNAAQVNMSPRSDIDEDRLEHDWIAFPIPLFMKGFTLDIREIDASRSRGGGLDVTHIEESTRKVIEKFDNAAMLGVTGLKINGASLNGLTNATNVNTETTSDDFGTSGNALAKIGLMIAALTADNYRGPNYLFFVARTQYEQLFSTINTNTDSTEMQLIQNSYGDRVRIIPNDSLTAGTCVLMDARRAVADFAIASDIQVVEWSSKGGWVSHFLVVMAGCLRAKSDYSGQSGIVYGTNI